MDYWTDGDVRCLIAATRQYRGDEKDFREKLGLRVRTVFAGGNEPLLTKAHHRALCVANMRRDCG